MTSADQERMNPEQLQRALITMCAFVTTYEILHRRVVTQVRTFFADDETFDGPKVVEEYKTAVYARDRNELRGCLLWFRDLDALTDADLLAFDKIRSYRNEITHEPVDCVATNRVPVYLNGFADLLSLLEKIEDWWHKKVGPSDKSPAWNTLLGARMLYRLAHGSGSDAWKVFEEYQQQEARGEERPPRSAVDTLH